MRRVIWLLGEGCTSQGEGVDVFTVITAGHVFLTQANGILALRDVVENLKFLLGNTLDSPPIQTPWQRHS